MLLSWSLSLWLAQAPRTARHLYLTLPEGLADQGVWVTAHLLKPPTGRERFRMGEMNQPAAATAYQFGKHRRWLLRAFFPTPADRPLTIEFIDRASLLGSLRFRSLPSERQALRFVEGGDCDVNEKTIRMFSLAGHQRPHFASLGGDLAYDDGLPQNYSRFDAWLDLWSRYLVTPEGDSVPLLPVVGNHEVQGGWDQTPEKATFFLPFLHRDQRQTYAFRRFTQGLGLWSLDSGHCAPPGGEQAAWLDRSLAENQALTHKFATYHVPLFPSHRDFNDPHSQSVRTAWLPLFDRHGLNLAFEHHEHTLKRTPPLRQGKPQPGGTIYLGDGCMGRESRPINSLKPYLKKASPRFHFWLCEVTRSNWNARAITDSGEVVDSVESR